MGSYPGSLGIHSAEDKCRGFLRCRKNPLNEIFAYFLDFHNSSYPSPLYALLDTKPGDAFDEDQHTKIMTREERKAAFFDKKKATVEGPIKEVVLYGYKNLKNGRVLKPSIVRV